MTNYPSRSQGYPHPALWLFIGVWKTITFLANFIGIVLSLVLGAIFMFLGFILTSTIVGAVIGIPLFIIGLLLFIRGLW